MLEELKVLFKLRNVAVRLYKNFIAKFRITQYWLEEIKFNIGVREGFPQSSTIFHIYIDKVADCWDDVDLVLDQLFLV
jgi:hypothetical protein